MTSLKQSIVVASWSLVSRPSTAQVFVNSVHLVLKRVNGNMEGQYIYDLRYVVESGLEACRAPLGGMGVDRNRCLLCPIYKLSHWKNSPLCACSTHVGRTSSTINSHVVCTLLPD